MRGNAPLGAKAEIRSNQELPDMKMPFGAERYKSVQVNTASPGGLLVLLYDGLFRFLREAEVSMKAGDRARAGERIDRAHAILTEFTTSLDRTIAPELCDTLSSLYVFCMERLVEANVHQDQTRLAEVFRVLTPLREAFNVAVQRDAAPATAMEAR
jgi:flagellar protein FliS